MEEDYIFEDTNKKNLLLRFWWRRDVKINYMRLYKY
jgi:hypothetical protein